MSKELPLNVVSSLEQFEASMINLAPIIAAYYMELVKQGIPPELAHKLTVDWCHLFWANQFDNARNKDE